MALQIIKDSEGYKVAVDVVTTTQEVTAFNTLDEAVAKFKELEAGQPQA